MSNIAKKSIKIDTGITITMQDGKVIVNGPKGTLEEKIPAGIVVTIEDGEVKIKKAVNAEAEKFAGLARALIANMVQGVSH